MELLLVVVLGGVFSTILIGFLVPSMRYTARNMTRSDMEMCAAALLDRLQADLTNTAPGGLGLLSQSGVAVPAGAPVQTNAQTCLAAAIDPIEGTDAAGAQVWTHQLIVYIYAAGEGRIYRKQFPIPVGAGGLDWPAVGPLRVSGTQLARIVSDKTTDAMTIAGHVTDFRMWTDGGADTLISNPVHVFVQMTQQDASQPQAQVFQAYRDIVMRQN
jgi:hypothetical protein